MLRETDPKQVVKTARNVFNVGSTKKIKFRVKQLENLVKFLQENEEEIVQSILEDLRRHREEARWEIYIVINQVNYLLDHVTQWLKPVKPSKRIVNIIDGLYVYHDPYGVVLVMGSWNCPLITLLPVAGAIAAGNCVVINPSNNSPNFARMLAKLLPQYLDSETYPVLLGDTERINELLEQKFDYIHYTGSAEVAKIVHRAANKYLTPTTLEMGGKNPVYIDSSANLKLTAERILWGKCFNSGQTCIAPDYILCTKDVEQIFLKHAKDALLKFYGGNSKCCPIVNEHHFQRLSKLLKGLTIAIGGGTDPLENCIEPTIAIDVKPDHPVMQEEIFGPILPIITVHDVKEAVHFINQREKALALYIFTKTSSLTEYILENTSCGGVTVNDTLMHFATESLPFGGVGSSGMGYFKGKYSIDTFSHKKSVLSKPFCPIIEMISKLRYPPYSKKNTDFLAFVMRYRRGPSWDWLPYILTFFLGFFIAFMLFYWAIM